MGIGVHISGPKMILTNPDHAIKTVQSFSSIFVCSVAGLNVASYCIYTFSSSIDFLSISSVFLFVG